MKGIIAALFSLFMLPLAVMSQNQSNDSTQKAKEQQVSYPIMRSVIAGDETVNSCVKMLKFDDAISSIEKKITQAKRKKESTANLEHMLDICNDGENRMEGTDHVIIVDSVVMDKHSFLSAYPIADDKGRLTMSQNGEMVQYEAQLNGMVLSPKYIDEPNGKRMIGIVRSFVDDGAEHATTIEGLDVDGDINYPYLLPDGQRFYFAARSSDGCGNYDLYATRYDNDSKRFYRAENMGYPYNSYANDYMLVIDEENNLGWFASDRYQPNGKVCIYTFIPNSTRHTLNSESLDPSQIRLEASLHSIAALAKTYSEDESNQKAAALQRILQMKQDFSNSSNREFVFVLNNSRTCYSINDFKSPEAKSLCSEWVQKNKNISTLKSQLSSLRSQSPLQKAKILNHESRILELKEEINSLAKAIRRAELEK